jgi:hypothetical protein
MNWNQIRRGAPYLLVVGLSVAFYIVGRVETSSQVRDVNGRVSRVESPCLKYGPKSRLCQMSFESALATLTHPEACAVERKAGTLKALRELGRELQVNFKEPCRGARLAQERVRSSERHKATAATGNGSTAVVPTAATNGGGPTSSPHTGPSQPAPGNGGGGEHGSGGSHGTHAPGNGGGHGGPAPGDGGGGGGHESGAPKPAPTPPSAPSSPGSSSSSTTERSTETVVVEPAAPEAPAPVRGAVGGLVEGVGHVVEETGGTVNGVVEGATNTTCTLAKLLC